MKKGGGENRGEEKGKEEQITLNETEGRQENRGEKKRRQQ